MAEFLDAFIRGGQAGRRAYENRHEDERESALGKLAGQAYSTPKEGRSSLLGDMAKYNPLMAQQQETRFESQDEKERTKVAGAAKFMLDAYNTKDPARIAGAYKVVLPILEEKGRPQGKVPPPEFQEDMVPHLYTILGQNGGSVNSNKYGDLPSDIQSLRILADNPDLAKLDKERRQYSGMVPKMVETSQGIGSWKPDGPITLSEITGPGQPSTQQPGPQATTQPGQSQSPPSMVNPGSDFSVLEAEFGIKPTSVFRSPKDNERVGGVANSYHLNGQASDWVPPPEKKANFMGRAKALGYEVIDEGDHIHIEPRSRNSVAAVSSSNGPRPAPVIAQPFVKPEAAPSGYRNNQDGTQSYVPGGPADPAVIAARPMDPAKTQKLLQQKQKEVASLDAMDAGLDKTITLINSIIADRGKLGGVTGAGAFGAKIPGTPWADTAAKLETLKAQSAFSSLQQMRANSPTGGALGSVTERELQLLQNAETQLQNTQSPEALLAALQAYRQQLLDTKDRMRSGVEEFYQQEAGPAPTQGDPNREQLLKDTLRKYSGGSQ